MAKQMGALMSRFDSSSRQCSSNKSTHRVGRTTETCKGRIALNEDPPRQTTWSAVAQIIRNCFSHILEQRQPIDTITFAPDAQFPCSPVKVLQLKSSHFAGPQAESSQEKQNRIVTSADSSAPITAPQQLLDLRRFQVARQL